MISPKFGLDSFLSLLFIYEKHSRRLSRSDVITTETWIRHFLKTFRWEVTLGWAAGDRTWCICLVFFYESIDTEVGSYCKMFLNLVCLSEFTTSFALSTCLVPHCYPGIFMFLPILRLSNVTDIINDLFQLYFHKDLLGVCEEKFQKMSGATDKFICFLKHSPLEKFWENVWILVHVWKQLNTHTPHIHSSSSSSLNDSLVSIVICLKSVVDSSLFGLLSGGIQCQGALLPLYPLLSYVTKAK